MKIFANLFRKKTGAVETPQLQDESESEFFFSVSESVHLGDLYEYRVTAASKKEAFDKLVQYFFGEERVEGVKSQHKTFRYPEDATFEVKNMPWWFGKRISGNVRDEDHNFQQMLEEYAERNGIQLKKG